MSQCENCENCDDQTSDDAAESSASIRHVFLLDAPEGVMSEEFKNHCLSVWSEENSALPTMPEICQMMVFLMKEDTPHLSEQGMHVFNHIVAVSLQRSGLDDDAITAQFMEFGIRPTENGLELVDVA